MSQTIIATKGNLISSKKSLQLASMGFGLLDQKRSVLVKEMMNLVEDVKVIREKISGSYQNAYDALQKANMSIGMIASLVESIPVDTGIIITYRSVMGVEIPKVIYEPKNQLWIYDLERSSSSVDYAYQCFNEVKQLTIQLAQIENSVFRLAKAIEKTQKRANALKNVSIPRLEYTVKTISDALEEKEREEFSRQKVIKEQKIKKAKIKS